MTRLYILFANDAHGRAHCYTTMQVVKTMTSGKQTGGEFVASCTSPRGDWLYCVAEDRVLYCFSMATVFCLFSGGLNSPDVTILFFQLQVCDSLSP